MGETPNMQQKPVSLKTSSTKQERRLYQARCMIVRVGLSAAALVAMASCATLNRASADTATGERTPTEVAPADTSPVPTQASAPFTCLGVSAEAVQLILGSDVQSVSVGRWGASTLTFSCVATASGDEHNRLQIRTLPPFAIGDGGKRSLVEYLGGSEVVHEIHADYPGFGYVAPVRGMNRAAWVCGETTVEVSLEGTVVDGRVPAEDVTNLLLSVLPWACDGQTPPDL